MDKNLTIEKIRLDKWLWYARFFKSRSLSSKFCHAGKVRVNGNIISKSHCTIIIGDTLTFTVGDKVRVVRVEQLGLRRGPAIEAKKLYLDLTPEFHSSKGINKLPNNKVAQREPGSGRPTKSERRAIDRFLLRNNNLD
jgi:ribosome-associated heat shock protein Hsp15